MKSGDLQHSCLLVKATQRYASTGLYEANIHWTLFLLSPCASHVLQAPTHRRNYTIPVVVPSPPQPENRLTRHGDSPVLSALQSVSRAKHTGIKRIIPKRYRENPAHTPFLQHTPRSMHPVRRSQHRGAYPCSMDVTNLHLCFRHTPTPRSRNSNPLRNSCRSCK